MLTKDEFIHHILGEAPRTQSRATKTDEGHIPGFDFADDAPDSEAAEETRFVRPLLQAGFGDGQGIPRATVIRSTDSVAQYIPDEVRYWPKTATRPHHTLLIEANLTHRELLAIPAFKSRQLAHLDIAEDAVARLVAEALEGFQRGAEGLDASALKGLKHETLCVVSIIDEREGHAGRLACFGTFNATTHGLETFFLTEHARTWDRGDARERLGLIYERQFKKLGEPSWQEAFTTTDERKQAEKLLEVCTKKDLAENDIQESILDLLDTIAKGFGLRKKPSVERRLQAFPLPGEHDIGIDSEERESKYGGTNPFSGVTLRDEQGRLLGYIVYPLKTKDDADKLRKHLKEHNRFHNVLVVYPDANQASIELWQGREQLTGKLRKGQGHKDAADVVNLLSRFFVVSKAKVRNPAELAQELAYRARYLRRLALKQLEDEVEDGALRTLYSEFKKALIHDLTEADFADAFAQTLTYSLLTARWVLSAQHDAAPARFSRKEAMKRLSLGSRFLSEMFSAVLEMKLDDRGRLLWLVDDVAELLDRIDIVAVFKPDGTDLTADPIVHFYEPFLAAYDAKVKMQRGAFYTPQPVVSYIVRSVHELLQTEFGLEDGLADTATWAEMLEKHPALKLPPLTDEPGETGTISPDEPFVQILDPATGTGTFLVEVIDVIHRTLVEKWTKQRLTDAQQRAAWNDYVPQHLLPRLHAYELMMAPYAIAHMKIGLKLAETGYQFGTEERARIYLTNALEPWVRQLPLIGFDALAHEAAAVNEIKRHKRFTVVIGNPPYSYMSANMNETSRALVEPFRFVDGERIVERGALVFERALQDDYVKFFGLTFQLLDASGSGILSMISNSAYLNSPHHRGMRSHITQKFSRYRALDLHGDIKSGADDDENVFDIKTGVAIGLGERLPGRNSFTCSVASLSGPRTRKEAALNAATLASHCERLFVPEPDQYFFNPTTGNSGDYGKWNSVADIFPLTSVGIKTNRDKLVIGFEDREIDARIQALMDPMRTTEQVKSELGIADNAQWTVADGRKMCRASYSQSNFKTLDYRPFDQRRIYYHPSVVFNPRPAVMAPLLKPGNLALLTNRRIRTNTHAHFFVSNRICMAELLSSADNCNVYPLWNVEESLLREDRRPNIAPSFLKTLSVSLKLAQKGAHGMPTGLTPEDIFHYAYAVFHSPGYRSRYAEFLKIDFPRLPLTGNLELFLALARLGSELTALHLVESPKLEQPITEFSGDRNREVGRIAWVENTVFIDAPVCKKGATQGPGKTGFVGVPEEVWNFHIGGYQVCEKWLKDRKGRSLSDEDIAHYQKIVVALAETIRLMNEIDNVIEEHGGWPSAFTTKEHVS